MTLSSYELNATYQKTSLEYEAKIMPVESAKTEHTKNDKELDTLDTNFSPVIFADVENLSNPQKLQKLLLEKILGGFSLDSSPQTLFPNDNLNVNKESYDNDNPYNQDSSSLNQGLFYSSNSEYYEKTTIDFSAQATIKTPNGEYNIEINFSYTREFYEKNETQISIANDNFKKPFEIELAEDDEGLKDLKSLHFIFDTFAEKDDNKKDIFEQIKELMAQRRQMILEIFKKDDDEKNIQAKAIDNFQIWQETNTQEMNLVAIQKDGIGVFLANSSSQSNFLNLNVDKNGYSLQSTYTSSETTITQINSNQEQ